MAGILIVDKHVYVRTKLALFSHHTVYHTRALRCERAECITNRSARPLARIYHDDGAAARMQPKRGWDLDRDRHCFVS